MITLGIDAHKSLHVAVAVNGNGREVGTWEGPNSMDGWRDLIGWAGRWEARQWGVEGSGGYGRGLSQELVHAGEKVYEVNPRLTAQARRRSRRRDKSDRLDARAVAAAVLREEDGLPMVTEGDEDAVALEVMARERERVKSQVDRLRNQLHNRLFQADPAYREKFPSLLKLETVKGLEEFAQQDASLVGRARAAAVRRVASALRLMIEQEGELRNEIEALAGARFAFLAGIRGVALLTAGSLAAVLGTRSFGSGDRFAAYSGAVPVETSSAGRVRHRLNRGGSRRLNSMLYRIALTQWRCGGEGRQYIERRMAEGKSWLEAVRALKRHIARAIWRAWQEHYAQPSAGPSA
jgi:transposase